MHNYTLAVAACIFAVSCGVSHAITRPPSALPELTKPANAVTQRMAQAPSFGPSLPGWYDGKYWHIWAEKKPIAADAVEEIWYALSDSPLHQLTAAEEKMRLSGRPADWTTDADGNVLLIVVDPVGNWNNGWYVVYRRNAQDYFEYTGTVHVGSHVGWWSKDIEFTEDGFTITFENAMGLPPVRHLFRYDKLENFCVPRLPLPHRANQPRKLSLAERYDLYSYHSRQRPHLHLAVETRLPH